MVGASVLVVEDEFLVAMQIDDLLTEAGYEVIGIISDLAGLATRRDAPELALIDLNLRDGPTGEMIARLLAERHATQIIYVTANPEEIGEPAVTAIVRKPFMPSAILDAVERAMSVANGEVDDAIRRSSALSVVPAV